VVGVGRSGSVRLLKAARAQACQSFWQSLVTSVKRYFMIPPGVMIRRASEGDRGNGGEVRHKIMPRPSLDPYAGTRVARGNALAGSGSAGPMLG